MPLERLCERRSAFSAKHHLSGVGRLIIYRCIFGLSRLKNYAYLSKKAHQLCSLFISPDICSVFKGSGITLMVKQKVMPPEGPSSG